MAIKLEVGKKYRDANGYVHLIDRNDISSCDQYTFSVNDGEKCFDVNGKRFGNFGPDLVAEVEENKPEESNLLDWKEAMRAFADGKQVQVLQGTRWIVVHQDPMTGVLGFHDHSKYHLAKQKYKVAVFKNDDEIDCFLSIAGAPSGWTQVTPWVEIEES